MDYLTRQERIFTKDESKKLREAVVYIAGSGGLGTHQAQQLQRIGVKKIYLVDKDKVEVSNLNRQIFYGYKDIGKYKVKKAKEVLEGFNLNTEIEIRKEIINKDTKIPSDVDIILDALDNFESRYILEGLARKYNIPFIHAGVDSWYGQITTIIPGKTTSLQDILGSVNKSKGVIPVISPVVSILASLQVIEAVKLIIGRKDTLENKLMLVDLRDYSIVKIDLNK